MKKLTQSYIIALSLIAIFTITSQIVIQNFLINQQSEATVINIAGRQRMLSQKITKQIFILFHSENLQSFEKEQQNLSEIYALWAESHQGLLQGSQSLNLPLREKSDSLEVLFKAIQPHYQAIEQAIQEILITPFEKKRLIEDSLLALIITNEAPFLELMNTIVFQYEVEANQKLKNLQITEAVLMAITLLILALEALLIFKPIIHQVKKYIVEVNDKNDELVAQDEELRQNLEEITLTQERLLENEKNLLTQLEKREVSNKMLQLSLTSFENIEGFLNKTIDTINQVSFLKFLQGIGVFLDNQKGGFDLVAQKGMAPETQKLCAVIKSGQCLCGRAIAQKTTQYASCVDDRHTTTFEGIEEHGHYNIPILYEEKAIGALVVYLPYGHAKNDNEISFLESIVAIVANTVKKIGAEQKIKEQNETLSSKGEELKQNLEELTTTQESLQEKQQQLKVTLAENLSINHALDNSAIISITDLKGNILKVNDIFCQISGFSEEELLGKNQNIVNSGFHPKSFWKGMWAIIGKGGTWRGEVKNKTKDGGEYWVDAVINPMYDDNGKIYRYLSIRYLITERKKAEQALVKINKDISASINYAQNIQSAILPTPTEIQQHLPNHFIFFKPKDVVSGDFYFFARKGYATVIAAVDCTGHGIPGAFMSLIGNNLLNEIVNVEGITEPNQILDALRHKIIKVLRQNENENKDGMDIAICTIHQIPDDMEDLMGKSYLEYAGAGNPLIYFQDNEINTLKGDFIIIGGFRNYTKDSKFKKHTISLDKPTTFYIFSDGIQDQFGGEMKRKFSRKRLRNLLQEIHQKPMEEQKEILSRDIQEWQVNGNEKQIDDMLLIGVHFP